METMKNIYESILSSVNAGKNSAAVLSDPDVFAKQYLQLTPKTDYFVTNGVLHILFMHSSTKVFVIDKNFPDIKFKIGSLATSLTKCNIIIKDWKIFTKYFGTNYGEPVKIGSIFDGKCYTTTYIQDPDFVSTSGPELDRIAKIQGNLVIDMADRITWSVFPTVEGNITINAKKIKKLDLPISHKTSIIKIKN